MKRGQKAIETWWWSHSTIINYLALQSSQILPACIKFSFVWLQVMNVFLFLPYGCPSSRHWTGILPGIQPDLDSKLTISKGLTTYFWLYLTCVEDGRTSGENNDQLFVLTWIIWDPRELCIIITKANVRFTNFLDPTCPQNRLRTRLVFSYNVFIVVEAVCDTLWLKRSTWITEYYIRLIIVYRVLFRITGLRIGFCTLSDV